MWAIVTGSFGRNKFVCRAEVHTEGYVSEVCPLLYKYLYGKTIEHMNRICESKGWAVTYYDL